MPDLIHPPRTRRQGNMIGCTPSASMTANPRSRLNGAVDIGCHMSHHTKILAALMWVAPGYSGISPELKFVNLVVVRKPKLAEQGRRCRQNDTEATSNAECARPCPGPTSSCRNCVRTEEPKTIRPALTALHLWSR